MFLKLKLSFLTSITNITQNSSKSLALELLQVGWLIFKRNSFKLNPDEMADYLLHISARDLASFLYRGLEYKARMNRVGNFINNCKKLNIAKIEYADKQYSIQFSKEVCMILLDSLDAKTDFIILPFSFIHFFVLDDKFRHGEISELEKAGFNIKNNSNYAFNLLLVFFGIVATNIVTNKNYKNPQILFDLADAGDNVSDKIYFYQSFAAKLKKLAGFLPGSCKSALNNDLGQFKNTIGKRLNRSLDLLQSLKMIVIESTDTIIRKCRSIKKICLSDRLFRFINELSSKRTVSYAAKTLKNQQAALFNKNVKNLRKNPATVLGLQYAESAENRFAQTQGFAQTNPLVIPEPEDDDFLISLG